VLIEDRDGAGRGAWLCERSLECLERGARSRAFSRALRTEIAPPSIAAIDASWRAVVGTESTVD